jgi:hypothetical protein
MSQVFRSATLEDRVPVRSGELPLFDELVQRLGDAGLSPRIQLIGDLAYDGLVPGLRRHLRNTGSHEPAPENANGLHLRHFVILG